MGTHPEICDFDILQKANGLDLSKLKIEIEETYKFPSEIKEESENLLSEYRRFLALKVISGDTSTPMMLSPSPLIDQVWHIHLLMPAHYLDCCRALGVDTIDHDPSSARDNEDIRRKRSIISSSKKLLHRCSGAYRVYRLFLTSVTMNQKRVADSDLDRIIFRNSCTCFSS